MHKHEPIPGATKSYGYCGHSVAPRRKAQNQAAQGGVTHYDYCECGAIRMRNSTGPGRTETGRWFRR